MRPAMPLPFTPAEDIFNVPAKCPAIMSAHAGSGIPSSCLLGGEGILGFELRAGPIPGPVSSGSSFLSANALGISFLGDLGDL